MEEYTSYQTRDGQRWDAIAQLVYGNPYAYEGIVFANPSYRHLLQLPGGVLLRIPVVAGTEPTIPKELLPPWKR